MILMIGLLSCGVWAVAPQDAGRTELWVTAVDAYGELVPNVYFDKAQAPTGNQGLALLTLDVPVFPGERYPIKIQAGSPWRLLITNDTVRIPEYPLEQILVYVVSTKKDAVPEVPARPLTLTDFARPDYMRIFHEGDQTQLAAKPALPLTYLAPLFDQLEDPLTLDMLKDAKAFMRELSPTLKQEAATKAMRSRAYQEEMTLLGMKKAFGPILNMGRVRAKGGTVMEEVAAMYATAAQDTLGPAQEAGYKDGRALALLYDDQPAAFRKIYDGIKQFIREDL